MCDAHEPRSAADIVQEAEMIADDAWGEGHDQEMEKMKQQGQVFLMDAVNRGVIPEEELDLELLAKARQRKLTQLQKAKQSLKTLTQSSHRLKHPEVVIDPSRVQIIEQETVPSIDFDFYVVDQLDETMFDGNLLFLCSLFGKAIVNSEYILSDGKEGTSMAFRAANSSRRRVWMSTCFRTQHPEMALLMDKALEAPGAKMSYMQEVDFLLRMQRASAEGGFKGYAMIGLVSNELKQDLLLRGFSFFPFFLGGRCSVVSMSLTRTMKFGKFLTTSSMRSSFVNSFPC